MYLVYSFSYVGGSDLTDEKSLLERREAVGRRALGLARRKSCCEASGQSVYTPPCMPRGNVRIATYRNGTAGATGQLNRGHDDPFFFATILDSRRCRLVGGGGLCVSPSAGPTRGWKFLAIVNWRYRIGLCGQIWGCGALQPGAFGGCSGFGGSTGAEYRRLRSVYFNNAD